jgi:hypothetical protein
LDDGPLMQDCGIIFCFQRCPVILLIEVGVIVAFILPDELALLVAFSLGHLEVELILILEMRLLLELVDHVLLLMVVLGALLVVLLLLEDAQVGTRLRLRSFAVLALGQSVLEC